MKFFLKMIGALVLLAILVAGGFYVFTQISHTELKIASIQQEPELPQGCEITSLAMVLNYYNFDIDKVTLADNYLPKQPIEQGVNPDKYYMGDPHGQGWYCYAGPIVEAANTYLNQQESNLAAYDISNATEKEICRYIKEGAPVILWSTLNCEEPRVSESIVWFVDNMDYHPYTNLHALVIYGYTYDSFLILDPQGGYGSFPKSQLLDAYVLLGSHAVVVR